MATATVETGQLTDRELMAHLFRRAGFGATQDELEAALARGYEATVEQLLHPEQQPELDEDLIFRYYVDFHESRKIDSAMSHWVYRMINTQRPLEEKMTLFWHCLFATGNAKVEAPPTMLQQIATFRQHALGNFRDILVELSKDPAMIFWLDNQENTKTVHNENYGRELLELFSMGIGNYSEDDVKECARAFTGWTFKNPIPAAKPYGRFKWEFEFRSDLHDYGEKTFLGETGNFDGDDIVDIVVRQPATAQFIARRLYLFFVSDRPDQAAIDELAEVYVQSGYEIRPMLRALFLSDFFRSRRGLLRDGQEPGRLRGRAAAPGRGLHLPEARHLRRGLRVPLHGPGSAEPAERRGLAHRQGVDRHRHPGRAGQLRRQRRHRSRASPVSARSSTGCGRPAICRPKPSSTAAWTCSARCRSARRPGPRCSTTSKAGSAALRRTATIPPPPSG